MTTTTPEIDQELVDCLAVAQVRMRTCLEAAVRLADRADDCRREAVLAREAAMVWADAAEVAARAIAKHIDAHRDSALRAAEVER